MRSWPSVRRAPSYSPRPRQITASASCSSRRERNSRPNGLPHSRWLRCVASMSLDSCAGTSNTPPWSVTTNGLPRSRAALNTVPPARLSAWAWNKPHARQTQEREKHREREQVAALFIELAPLLAVQAEERVAIRITADGRVVPHLAPLVAQGEAGVNFRLPALRPLLGNQRGENRFRSAPLVLHEPPRDVDDAPRAVRHRASPVLPRARAFSRCWMARTSVATVL